MIIYLSLLYVYFEVINESNVCRVVFLSGSRSFRFLINAVYPTEISIDFSSHSRWRCNREGS